MANAPAELFQSINFFNHFRNLGMPNSKKRNATSILKRAIEALEPRIQLSTAAPTGIILTSGSDTGIVGDNLTKLNNSSGKTLGFNISGTITDATVFLYADGNLIGQAVATGSTTVLTTNGTTTLTDGLHNFTAKQWTASSTISDATSATTISIDTVAPQVTGVLARSTNWAQSILDYMTANGYGSGGYSINQSRTMPWNNVNQLIINFTEDVNVVQSSLNLLGSTVANYSTNGFAYSNNQATWSLASALGNDRLLVDLSDSITDAAGNALDGEWTTGQSAPSGNGMADGHLLFRFDSLPGDSNGNGVVLSNDVNAVRLLQFTTANSGGNYSIYSDIDGSGVILSNDVNAVRLLQFTLLPTSNPNWHIPTSPSYLTALQSSSGEVELSWLHDPQDNSEDGFVIYRQTEADRSEGIPPQEIARVDSDVTSWMDSTPPVGNPVYYSVASYNIFGVSSPSSWLVYILPATPSGLVVTDLQPSQISLSWNDVSEEMGYHIYRKIVGGSWSQIGDTQSGVTVYTDTNVVSGSKYVYGVDAYVVIGNSEITEVGPALARDGASDEDLDGLSNLDEANRRTDPTNYDSDDDGLADGWETIYGLSPLNGDQNGNGIIDGLDDFDQDGLNNLSENNHFTDPTNQDSDGDGATDSTETSSGSDPNDAADEGKSPANDMVQQFTIGVGDTSGSSSERWALRVGDIQHTSHGYGQYGEDQYSFKAGDRYDIRLIHLGSIYTTPDYDWTASIVPTPGDQQLPYFVVDDAPKILGSYDPSNVNTVANKTSYLYIPLLDADVDSNNDGGFTPPVDNEDEDRLEQNASTGKLIQANTGDLDEDGVPDYADLNGVSGLNFVPMVLRLSENISQAQISQINLSFDYSGPAVEELQNQRNGSGTSQDPYVYTPAGQLRIWTKNGDAVRSIEDDFIAPGDAVSAADLGLIPGGEITLYIEAAENTSDALTVTASANIDGAKWSGVVQDAIQVQSAWVDLDIDSDNNSGLDAPQRSKEEEGHEDINGQAGKVALVNDFDQDHDGLKDFVDGYDFFSGVSIDQTSNAKFVPIVIELPSVDLSSAKMRFTYSDSDPFGVTQTVTGYELAEGHIRLWAKDGIDVRNGNPISDGGDFLPSGEYSVSSLFSGSLTKTIFAELVRTSDEVGDQKITVELDIDGDGIYEAKDDVRLTATRVELVAYDYDENSRISSSFIPTDFTAIPDAFTHLRFQTYVIKVFDPRESGLSQLTLYGQALLLHRVGDHYETPEFVVKTAGASMSWSIAGMPVIEMSSSDVDLQYNPGWNWLFGGESVNDMPAGFEALAPVIKEEVDAMEAAGWTPANPANTGAFGSEVHRRVGQRMSGQEGWLVDVYVQEQTDGSHRIVSIGAVPPGGVGGTTQIDLLHLAPDYNPQVNDIIDRTKIQNLFDIKTSLNNGFSGGAGIDQLARLKAVNGGRDIVVAKSYKRWTSGSGWHVNNKFKLGAELLGYIGVATSAWAILNYHSHDQQLDAVLEDAQRVLQRQQSGQYDNGEEGRSQRLVDLMVVNEGFSAYLSNFSPDSTITDIVKGINALVIINKVLE